MITTAIVPHAIRCILHLIQNSKKRIDRDREGREIQSRINTYFYLLIEITLGIKFIKFLSTLRFKLSNSFLHTIHMVGKDWRCSSGTPLAIQHVGTLKLQVYFLPGSGWQFSEWWGVILFKVFDPSTQKKKKQRNLKE